METGSSIVEKKGSSARPEDHDHELVPGTPAIKGITEALVIKDGNVFFLSERDGSVPLTHNHGFGLYYNDCRFLNGYELRIGGHRPEVLVRNAERDYMATLGMFNPDLHLPEGDVPKHSVEVRWQRVISNAHSALFDSIALQNLTVEPIRLPLALTFGAAFEDIFTIRGLYASKRGTIRPPSWENDCLNFQYDGADGITRTLTIRFSLKPDKTHNASAHFTIDLPPKGCGDLMVSLLIATSETRVNMPKRCPDNLESARNSVDEGHARWLREKTHVHTDSLLLTRIMDRSVRDLGMLRTHLGRDVTYFAAGVPWFVALFGRDSIITALQTLAYDSRIAGQTIRLLAQYQGKEVNPWREEEPGKILHELRVGEMANLHEIPHTPYYGTIDATPLWLVLVGRYLAWTGDLDLFKEFLPHVDAALTWIDKYGDSDGDGYVEYECKIQKGLVNQGWKDSGDGIVNKDGSLAVPPIALIEVQGYVYEAKREMAALYRRLGRSDRAAELEQQADDLRARVNRDFWVNDGYYALALQGKDNRPAAVLSSNAGHALWSGIAEDEHAHRVMTHLLSPDMFNGWGIRTISEAAVRYNPLSYHLGTVWPHDNSLIAAGFKRYGFDDAALHVFNGLMNAAMHFEACRLPELFGGFPLDEYGIPVSYPVACQPQAWAAGAMPYLLTILLGLEPNAFERTLRIVRPLLPSNVNRVEVQGLKVGNARADLLFERQQERVDVRVVKLTGELEVVVEHENRAGRAAL